MVRQAEKTSQDRDKNSRIKKFKKGDKVIVLAGRDKGKQGEILKVIPAEQRVIVAGVNLLTRHQRATPLQGGGIVKKEGSIHISNIALVDPASGKATRAGFKKLENGEKVRIAKKSGEMIAN